MPTTYLPASWAGMTFYIRSDSLSFGRHQALTPLPRSPRVCVEDIGRKARSFTVEAYFNGEDAFSQAQRFIQLAETQTAPATLVHPILGNHTVSLTEASLVLLDDTHTQRYVGMSLSFTETQPAQSAKAILALTPPTLTAGLVALQASAVAQLSPLQQVQASLRQALGAVLAQASHLQGKLGGWLTKGQSLRSQLAAVSLSVEGLVGSLLSLFAGLADLLPSDRLALTTALLNSPTPNATADSNPTAIASTLAVLQQAALLYRSEAVASQGYTSTKDALNALAEQRRFVDALLPTFTDAAFYEAMQDALTASESAVRAVAKRLPQVRTLQLAESLPALVAAYHTQGDALKASDLMARNGLHDWNAVPAHQPLEVLNA